MTGQGQPAPVPLSRRPPRTVARALGEHSGPPSPVPPRRGAWRPRALLGQRGKRDAAGAWGASCPGVRGSGGPGCIERSQSLPRCSAAVEMGMVASPTADCGVRKHLARPSIHRPGHLFSLGLAADGSIRS